MPSGSTNRSKTAYVLESTFGTTPATPAFQELRVTSNGLEYKPTRTTSAEIRSDRQVSDQILTKFDASGTIGLELSFQTFDDFLQAVLQGTWVNQPQQSVTALTTTTATVAAGTTFKAQMLALTSGFAVSANNGLFVVSSSGSTSVVFPASSFTAEASPPAAAALRVVGFQGASGDIVAVTNGLNSTSLDFTTLGLSVGEYVLIGGDAAATQFATAADNGWARILSIAAHAIVFDVFPASWAADAGTSKTIQVFYGDFVANGTTQRSFTIERQQQDLTSPSYEYFTGMQLDQMALTLKASAIITGSMDFMGMGASASTTRFAGATDLSPTTTPVMNAASNVGTLLVGGSAVGGPSYISELGMTIKNNLAEQDAVGSLPAIGIRNGELDVSGNFTSYFGDLTNLNLVLNDSDTSIMFRAKRTDASAVGQCNIFSVPAAKVTGTSPVSAKNQDRMFTGTYQAKKSATLGITASAQRIWYLPLVAR